MLRISIDLSERLKQAIHTLQASGELPAFEPPPVKVSRSARAELGDYSSAVGLQLAGVSRAKPDHLAKLVLTKFSLPDYLQSAEIAGGYINFRLAPQWLQGQIDVIIDAGSQYGNVGIYSGKNAQVECVSANPTGPITVGRIRGGVIGDTLARLLRACGYNVEMEYYYNDAGAQIDKLGLSLRARYLERLGLEFQLPEDGYKGDYLKSLAEMLVEDKGMSLVEGANDDVYKNYAVEKIALSQREALRRINIVFSSYFSEQSLYDDGSIERALARLRELDLIYESVHPESDPDTDTRPDTEEIEAAASGPATWLRIRKIRGLGNDKALVRSNGVPTYRLPDIAYHIYKMERGYSLAVNILGADHIEEAKDIKATIGALGYEAERIQHIIHQFVTLKGKRMGTRSGEFVTLDELANEVGADAVRYFMLARSPDSRIDFDLDLAKEQSNENPVYYIQNAHVRCVSIGRVAAARRVSAENGNLSLLNEPQELALIKRLIELPEIIDECVRDLAPHKLAFWAHEDLARTFHTTYEDIRALHGDVPADIAKARLKLYAAARIVIANALELMGMNAPDEM